MTITAPQSHTLCFNGAIADELLVLNPNRSLSFVGLRQVLLGFAGVCLTIALLSALVGNYFAPIFALIDIVVVSAALLVAWHLGDAQDMVQYRDGVLIIRKDRGRHQWQYQFQPTWASALMECMADNEPHLIVQCRGERVEIGSFLNIEQRQAVFPHLRAILSLARERSVSKMES